MDVTSICEAGGKVFKPSSLMAPEGRPGRGLGVAEGLSIPQ